MSQSIGRYQVSDTIGRGGMGVVYKAFDPMLQRTVALKVISGISIDEGDARERLLREARAAGQLAHRNIVVIHDLGEEHGQPYVAMEYLTGTGLDAQIRGGPLPLDRTIDLVMQLCDGLEYAHRRDLVHRDIKPANLFVTDAGDLKILDFGLVHVLSSSLTRSREVVGTVSYMAPEQVRGERVDHRVDIFAAGAVLYELVAGHRAFDGDSIATTMYKILEERPAPIDQFAQDLPPGLAAVVDRALAKQPEQRYQSASDMRRDLDACRGSVAVRITFPALAGSVPGSVAQTAVLGAAAPGSPRMRNATMAAAAVVVAAGVWLWITRGQPAAPVAAQPSETAASAALTTPPASDAVSSPAVAAASETVPAPVPAPQPVTRSTAAVPAGSASPDRAASTAADRRAIAAAAERVEQARAAADSADARTLASVQYASAAALDAEARAVADTLPMADVTARLVEAEARFRAAAIEARAEARARATPAPSPPGAPTSQTAAPPQNATSPPVAQPEPPRTESRPAADGRPGETAAAPARGGGTADDTLPPRSPVSTEAILRDVVPQYIAALEGRSMAALKRLWPTLTGVQERAIQAEFGNARSVQVRFTDPRITVDGSTATVIGTRDYRLVTQDGQQLSTVTRTTLTLRKTGEVWRIESILHQPR